MESIKRSGKKNMNKNHPTTKKATIYKYFIILCSRNIVDPNLSGVGLVEDFDIPKPLIKAALNYIEAKAGLKNM